MIKRLSPLCLLLLLLNSSFLLAAPTVGVEVIHSRSGYLPGESYPLILKLTIAPSWYIHCPDDDEAGLIPTKITFDSTPSYSISDIRFPEALKKEFSFTSRPIKVYGGEVLVLTKLRLDKGLPPGNVVIKGALSYQACNDNSCLAPEKIDLEIPLTILPPGTPTQLLNRDFFSSVEENRLVKDAESEPTQSSRLSKSGFWMALFIFFVVGLGLNLTPCIYPLIPITVGYFSGRKQGNWGARILHGVCYILGLSVTNSILGTTAALTGSMLGLLLQNPIVLIFIAAVMFILALNFFGFWELRLPSSLNRAASRNYGGFYGTVFMGLTMGILAAPCLGPAILSMLTFVAQKGDPFFGFICFFVMSVGLGIPLALLGIFSGAIDKLPMSGDWMVWVRKFMGWVMIGMGSYYLSLLFSQGSVRLLLFGAVLVLAAIHLGWLDRSGKDSAGFLTFKKAFGFLILLTGIGFFYYGLNQRDLSHQEIGWVSFNNGLIQEAAEADKPLLLDFYADWCNPCRIMELKVFRSSEFIALSQEFIISRIDLTREDDRQAELVKKFEIRGVPTVIFYDRQGKELRKLRLEHYEGKREFLNRMKQALKE